MGAAVCSPANKPLSMAKISLKVRVRVVPMEVDHRPSALRKIPPLFGEEGWIARLACAGGEWIKLAAEWRDRDTSGCIVQRRPGGRQKVYLKGWDET